MLTGDNGNGVYVDAASTACAQLMHPPQLTPGAILLNRSCALT